MLRNVNYLTDTLRSQKDFLSQSLLNFIEFIEKRTGGKLCQVSNQDMPNPVLLPLYKIADELHKKGVIKKFFKARTMRDEPLRYSWVVECGGGGTHYAGGMSAHADYNALIASLAESVERYLWFYANDFFKKPLTKTLGEMKDSQLAYIDINRFSGYDNKLKTKFPSLQITDDDSFVWIKAYSWVQKKDIYVPVQTVVSGRQLSKKEKNIRTPITTGLATWSSRNGALLRGILEIVERDAYMIHWLNQLHLPKINLETKVQKNSSLAELLDRCNKYGLVVNATKLLSDAPTHIVCVSIVDKYKHDPEIVIGLGANQSLEKAIESGLMESLRMRQNIRNQLDRGKAWDETREISSINHTERTLYWARSEKTAGLTFLCGRDEYLEDHQYDWESDTDEEHFLRLLEWIKKKGYEMYSVSFTESEYNVSPWHIEMVVIPELQPMHQNESLPFLEGRRLTEIPLQFGYDARKEPFASEPHPFA